MAHGLLCVRCGHQETQHYHPEYLPEGVHCCKSFKDGIKHLEGCPREHCTGNCKATIEHVSWAAQIEQGRAEHSLAFVRNPNGRFAIAMADMGS